MPSPTEGKDEARENETVQEKTPDGRERDTEGFNCARTAPSNVIQVTKYEYMCRPISLSHNSVGLSRAFGDKVFSSSVFVTKGVIFPPMTPSTALLTHRTEKSGPKKTTEKHLQCPQKNAILGESIPTPFLAPRLANGTSDSQETTLSVFELSLAESWIQIEEIHERQMQTKQILMLFAENNDQKEFRETMVIKNAPAEYDTHHTLLPKPPRELPLRSAQHASEGRFGDGKSRIHQTSNQFFTSRMPSNSETAALIGQATEPPEPQLLACPFTIASTRCCRDQTPRILGVWGYRFRLETFLGLTFYLEHPIPSVHDLASSGLRHSGIFVICCGCNACHLRIRLINKDPRGSQFHNPCCDFSRPRPMCSTCLQSPTTTREDLGRCVRCHHDPKVSMTLIEDHCARDGTPVSELSCQVRPIPLKPGIDVSGVF